MSVPPSAPAASPVSCSATSPASQTPGSGVLRVKPLGFPWPTVDPFLFCAYHDDAYPAANGRLGPAASLTGRTLGQDFSRRDGWSMYHGDAVPGFPAHPHRGFETVTMVRKGLVDHADSLGAVARFGEGDVQWLTAGAGIVHAEMFPLLATGAANPLELFQIWLNLPACRKMAAPHFTMHWSPDIARHAASDDQGHRTEVAVIAGRLAEVDAVPPPPDSWAAEAEADVAIWTLRMAPGARWTLPPALGAETQRSLYFFKGERVTLGGQALDSHAALELQAGRAIEIVNTGRHDAEFLLLQGRPIGEPVVQYGPFVMNTQAEIRQTLEDYRRTQFGGWPWPEPGPLQGLAPARFARHPDGHEERPGAEMPAR